PIMLALAGLPVGFFLLTLAALAANHELREAFIMAAAVWGLVVVVSTEVLSLFNAVTAPFLIVLWTAACAASASLVWQRRVRLRTRIPVDRAGVLARAAAAVLPLLPIAFLTGLVAVMAPPNTWDSMTFHLARVAHWAADGSVAPYA